MANDKPLRTLTDIQKGVAEVLDFIEAKPGQKRRAATLPLTKRFRL
jgi:hypothetical protein